MASLEKHGSSAKSGSRTARVDKETKKKRKQRKRAGVGTASLERKRDIKIQNGNKYKWNDVVKLIEYLRGIGRGANGRVAGRGEAGIMHYAAASFTPAAGQSELQSEPFTPTPHPPPIPPPRPPR